VSVGEGKVAGQARRREVGGMYGVRAPACRSVGVGKRVGVEAQAVRPNTITGRIQTIFKVVLFKTRDNMCRL